jgi:hypothetical protein
MGIKFYCPSCDKRLNVKTFLAGKAGFCPHCQAKLQIPTESEPKRAKSVEGGASMILRQPAHQDEVSESPVVAATQSTNGHGRQHAAPAAVPSAGQNPTPAHVAASASAAPQSAPYAAPGYPTGAPAGAAPAGYAAYTQPAARVAAAPVAPVAPAAPVAAAPATVDPIAEAPQCVWYVRPPAGGQYGPAAGDVMRKWLAEGRVSAESLVWREGWPDWRKAAKVFPSLAPLTAPAMAPVAPVAPVAAAAPAAPTRRNIRTARKQNSTAIAITAISVLVVLSIGLLIGLLYVLGAL